jgi:alkylated DNA repair dioxygenase AlkB
LSNPARCFGELAAGVKWDNSMASRQTASFGVAYNYGHMQYPICPIPPSLASLASVQHALRVRVQVEFNNCLLNFYESGDSSLGFHSDNLDELAEGTSVAIVSLGHQRTLTFRRKDDGRIESSLVLPSGSLLYVDDTVQTPWLHAVKPEPGAGARISLTWRQLRAFDDRAKPLGLTMDVVAKSSVA